MEEKKLKGVIGSRAMRAYSELAEQKSGELLTPQPPAPAVAPKRLKEEGVTGEPGMVIFARGSWKTAYQIQADGSWRKLEEGLALSLREDWEKRGRPEK